ncbi:MAG TPA: hypothetical protein VFN38_18000 [Gemmatimonadaceae bacterium]|nr:hypothetical protein [Gemmatimonadaceae bacterium]
MAMVLIQEPPIPITGEMYDAVSAKLDLDNEPPEGMIAHTAGADESGQWRIVDVWESAEAFQTFRSERLGPAIEATAREFGVEAGEPKMTMYDAHHVLVPAPAHAHA